MQVRVGVALCWCLGVRTTWCPACVVWARVLWLSGCVSVVAWFDFSPLLLPV